MSLRLIYGKTGTGKSKFCLDEIASRVKEKDKIYIITPEQFSFVTEQKLLNSLENKAVINAEVLTFNRMAYRIALDVRRGYKSRTFKTRKSNANIQHTTK